MMGIMDVFRGKAETTEKEWHRSKNTIKSTDEEISAVKEKLKSRIKKDKENVQEILDLQKTLEAQKEDFNTNIDLNKKKLSDLEKVKLSIDEKSKEKE